MKTRTYIYIYIELNPIGYPDKGKPRGQDWRENMLVQWPHTIVIHSHDAISFQKREAIFVP
jgi:hypothetical protein